MEQSKRAMEWKTPTLQADTVNEVTLPATLLSAVRAELLQHHTRSWSNYPTGDSRRAIAFKASDLIRVALSAFEGHYSSGMEFRGVCTGGRLWQNEAPRSSDSVLRCSQILTDVEATARLLMRAVNRQEEPWMDLHEPFATAWLCPDLSSSKKGIIRGIAVQVIACAGAALAELREGHDARAGNRLGAAYDNMILLHLECEEFIRKKNQLHQEFPAAVNRECGMRASGSTRTKRRVVLL